VLVLCDFYLPGYRAGGPIRTLAGVVEHLSPEFRFTVACRDRDYLATEPYEGISTGSPQPVGAAEVVYLAPRHLSPWALAQLIRRSGADVIYVNSLFSTRFGIVPLLLRRVGAIPGVPLVLAPRGETAAGALALSRTRKRVYLAVARGLGFFRGVIWQASSEFERADIVARFGPAVEVAIAVDLAQRGAPPGAPAPSRADKQPGHLELLFLGRIAPMKNLEMGLEALRKVTGRVRFSIYGPVDDRAYWELCKRLIKQLPDNVQAEYRGEVPHEQVRGLMQSHDLLFLPTRGENFGHAIVEALTAGCPVLISDRTQWRGLRDSSAGWDLPLSEPGAFTAAIEQCVAMDARTYGELSRGAAALGARVAKDEAGVEQNRLLFRRALRSG
jgi:glycosyltransferase involved in cell wall biosynthesis